ncbi:lytic polysaccharide monooxygenase [Streptomyces sp. NBC_00053]|uniref:lytic polysaccharide monooxygenase auxiliary activity family 9 protein n=1 Tax=unclassified Streptomyces TaxID=2593676 RepID=UPI00225A7615|nr:MULTISPECIES: lytic polysaccharide monooxygenase auxiliary activity family 9 protein [unclassified Streptomyces]WSG51005.1 lytic polysaccharide monooxygenase [Streptomyces sp. NBC_01732]WSX01656.1 lytic polysaccharide monooxygenase [Streptomyces sp. NBC_00987]MCX4396445.1 lytic polysaccharide monooxygenase [Streptomyces sp. NBC_01767]MCX5100905.1 lytic polysaccharide monooxygenase [Streptomyces sp. NBC_00439]MCX5160429.1 lytic polysaccharide monooxygenase [Streptomyces sp. NBC_00305]
MRKRASAAVVGLAIAGVSMFATSSASSHGYTDNPISRQKLCANGTVTGCGNIQWEPQSVEGPKGFPAAGPADGKICSGGHGEFAQLDDPRGGNWPATNVTGGQGFSFRWQFTARHATSDFRYYITKDGWDPTKPLTRADLESQPFMTVPYGGKQPPATLTQQGTIPTQKSGKHIILSVWNVADTANAFYACSDVQF